MTCGEWIRQRVSAARKPASRLAPPPRPGRPRRFGPWSLSRRIKLNRNRAITVAAIADAIPRTSTTRSAFPRGEAGNDFPNEAPARRSPLGPVIPVWSPLNRSLRRRTKIRIRANSPAASANAAVLKPVAETRAIPNRSTTIPPDGRGDDSESRPRRRTARFVSDRDVGLVFAGPVGPRSSRRRAGPAAENPNVASPVTGGATTANRWRFPVAVSPDPERFRTGALPADPGAVSAIRIDAR